MTASPANLDAEFAAARANLGCMAGDLIAWGIPRRVIERYGLIGIASVRSTHGHLFEFDSQGKLALVVPVRSCGGVKFPEDRNAETAAVLGSIIDFVAFIPTRPQAFLRYTGFGRFLGFCPATGPVHVWLSPWQWLLADCAGVVPLDRDPSKVCDTLEGISAGLIACSVEHGRSLRSSLAQSIWPPPIFVHPNAEGAAA